MHPRLLEAVVLLTQNDEFADSMAMPEKFTCLNHKEANKCTRKNTFKFYLAKWYFIVVMCSTVTHSQKIKYYSKKFRFPISYIIYKTEFYKYQVLLNPTLIYFHFSICLHICSQVYVCHIVTKYFAGRKEGNYTLFYKYC